MTFSEYCETEAFQKELKRKRLREKNSKYGLILGVALLILLTPLMLLFEFVPEERWEEKWFIALAVILAVFAFAAIIAEGIISPRSRARGSFVNDFLGVGFLLRLRESEVDWKRYLSNGVLDVRILLPKTKNLQVDWVEIGSGEDAIRFDFAPWGGVSNLEALGFVCFALIAYLTSEAASCEVITAVRVPVDFLDGFSGTKTSGGLNFLVKKGKWTWTGKLMRHDYRRAEKIIQKRGY